MSTFTAESHRGAGTLPVPSTPLGSQVQDDGLVLVDGPLLIHDTSIISNADVGEERSFIGPIESVLIRGRGTNQAISAQSVGLTLTQMAPPWPNMNVSADPSARHGSGAGYATIYCCRPIHGRGRLASPTPTGQPYKVTSGATDVRSNYFQREVADP